MYVMRISEIIIVFLLPFATLSYGLAIDSKEKSADYWLNEGQQKLIKATHFKPNTNIAKNIIIFVGDGMGISTVTAARIYQGQQKGLKGEEYQLVFEKFPFVALSKTYNVDKQVPDSAATATALFTGVKTNFMTLGVSPKVRLGDCSSALKNKVSSILQWAQEAGKDTGIVTTTRITHATPAATYAHSANRFWESDALMPSNATNICKDISRQLVEDLPGRNLKVILGGGSRYFLPNGTQSGSRLDGRNLLNEWEKDKIQRKLKSKIVRNAKELQSALKEPVDSLLGLFHEDNMNFELHRTMNNTGEPSLSEMTESAIKVLQKNKEKGFFLMVEGGRIDHGHHMNSAKLALEDVAAFEAAIQTALSMTSIAETLVIVTADHSHVFTINGYPDRGNPILGKTGQIAKDNMPYTTLMYTNGNVPYFGSNTSRSNLTHVNTESHTFTQEAVVPLDSETHGGEDVAIYAIGPMSYLFHGVVEQNYVAHVMAYASCIGQYKDNKDICHPLSHAMEEDFLVSDGILTHFHNSFLVFLIVCVNWIFAQMHTL